MKAINRLKGNEEVRRKEKTLINEQVSPKEENMGCGVGWS